MLRYAFWRLVQACVAIFGVMTIVFVIMRLSGDPTLLLVPEGASREHIELCATSSASTGPSSCNTSPISAELIRLDLGMSVVQRMPAVDILATRIPYTLALAGGALLVALGVGLPVGVVMARQARRAAGARAGARWC